MARLRMTRYIGGFHGQPPELWPTPGEVVELEDENLISELLRSKAAVLVPEEKPAPKPEPKPEPVVETAEAAPPENTAKRTAKPKPRTRKTT